MWRRGSGAIVVRYCRYFHNTRRQLSPEDIIKINNATFYRKHPSPTSGAALNPALFPNLSFVLPANKAARSAYSDGGISQYWAVISSSSIARTTFLQVLAGNHYSIPPTARSYPYFAGLSQLPQHAIKYVGFDAERGSSVGGNSVRGAYLSARYESRREETDYAVHAYLTGHTELNALDHEETAIDPGYLAEVIAKLRLELVLDLPVSSLSNGQTRRARIAKALLARPEVLLLDGPFMGLDPGSLNHISAVLQDIAHTKRPRVILSLRPEDGIPEWISHLVIVSDNLEVLAQGFKHQVLDLTQPDEPNEAMVDIMAAIMQGCSTALTTRRSRDGFASNSPSPSKGEALVEMNGVRVVYGDKAVLGNWRQHVDGDDRSGLWWSLHRGQRCGIFGPNGSGKTTMLSLITSDHPQTYSLPIKLFGRSRLPGLGQPGISLFDLQKRMGHSSPEVHAFFPKHLSVRRAIESSWADAPLARPQLSAEAISKVDACLRWFATELHPEQKGPTARERLERGAIDEDRLRAYDVMQSDKTDLAWADKVILRDLSFSSQRLTLFLRAVVASPDLVILDEALSGIDEVIRDKALLFLSHGEKLSGVNGNEVEESTLSRLGKVTVSGLSEEQALLVISHSKQDVPGCVRDWICLPEPVEGRAPRIGLLTGPLELNPAGWKDIWGSA